MIYSFLQYRAHEPDKRFYDFGSHGAAFPPVQRDTPALLHVADENFLHLGCCFGTVHELWSKLRKSKLVEPIVENSSSMIRLLACRNPPS